MRIGVFDTGHGGQLVTDELRRLLPKHEYVVVDDRAHAPYGERSLEEVARLTDTAIQPLLRDCRIIILACNTATAAAIHQLRARYPSHHFIGFEPMIKGAAAQTKTGRITLLATHATAHSARTRELIRLHGAALTIDIPTTYGWATAVDAGQAETIDFSEVKASVSSGSDVIILGCTHYNALRERLATGFPGVTLLEPTVAVTRRVQAMAAELLLL